MDTVPEYVQQNQTIPYHYTLSHASFRKVKLEWNRTTVPLISNEPPSIISFLSSTFLLKWNEDPCNIANFSVQLQIAC